MVKLIGIAAIWIGCLVLALAGGWDAMWVIVYLVAALVLVSWGWARLNVNGLELRRRHPVARMQVGTEFVEQAILEPRGQWSQYLPRVWLEIEDHSSLPGHRLDRVVSLGVQDRRVWEARSICVQRGRFFLGPVWARSSDPFGLFTSSRELEPAETVVVYPRIVDLPQFGRVPGELPGGTLQGLRPRVTTPNVASVREYAPGDPMNRIHWASTARTGKLMVREFELDPTADVWLVLDLDREVQRGYGPESTEEYAITVAASIARRFIVEGRSVGLISQSVTVPLDRGPRQLERLLEVFAVVRATSYLALDGLLTAEVARMSRSSTLVVITASTEEKWVGLAQQLIGRGVRTLSVLVEADTFGRGPSSIMLLSSLLASRIPAYLVRRGEPIDIALSTPHGSAVLGG